MHKHVAGIIEMIGGEWLGSSESLQQMIIGISTDSRKVEANTLFIPIIGENFDGHRFVQAALEKGAIMALWKRDHTLEPPANSPILLVDDPLESLQTMAHLYLKQVGCRVVAITGSNGKTTTKDIVSSLLKVKYRTHANIGNLNNEIGLPLTILAMPEDTEVVVLEMGMNHFGEIALLSRIAEPDVAIITNIGDAHIEHLGSRAGIARAKLEILTGMDQNATLLYPGNEPLITEEEVFQQFQGNKLSCGVEGNYDQVVNVIENQGLDGLLLEDPSTHDQYHLPIPGIHNAQNVAFALKVGTLFHMSASEIKKGLADVTISKMRMELLEGKNGVTIINDAYNASLLSIKAALRLLSDLQKWPQKVVVLGDVGELGTYGPSTHQEIGKALDPVEFPTVFVTGTLSKHIVEGAKQAGYHQVRHIDTKEMLLAELQPYLNAETIILFKASRFMELEQVVQSLV